jgi:hypothetical protein
MATKRCSRQRAIPAFRVGIIVWRQKETSLVLLEHSVTPPLHGLAERPKLSDPAHGTRGLQPKRDGRVRCSA